MTSEEKSTATDSTVQGAELLRAGGKGDRSGTSRDEILGNPYSSAVGLPIKPAGGACRADVVTSSASGLSPLIVCAGSPGTVIERIKAPTEAGEVTAEAIRGETFMPIRALLPVWIDSVTGNPVTLDELRAALMGEQ